MLSKTILSTVILSYIAAVSASPNRLSVVETTEQLERRSGATCNSGAVQCCNQVIPANQVDFSRILPSSLLGLLPINLQGLSIPVGLDCTPVDILGLGGNSCSITTVCCENNNFSGVVAIGCTPIDVSL